MRRAARLSALQWAALAMMIAALAAGGVAAGVLLSRPPASAAAIPVAGPPLDNPAVRIGATPASSTGAIPATVRLIVPEGRIDVPVIEGDGASVPLGRAMHYPGTGEPGGGSTSLFYAHARTGMFLGCGNCTPAMRSARSAPTAR